MPYESGYQINHCNEQTRYTQLHISLIRGFVILNYIFMSFHYQINWKILHEKLNSKKLITWIMVGYISIQGLLNQKSVKHIILYYTEINTWIYSKSNDQCMNIDWYHLPFVRDTQTWFNSTAPYLISPITF